MLQVGLILSNSLPSAIYLHVDDSCEQEGHSARDCPEPPNPANMKCRNCDESTYLHQPLSPCLLCFTNFYAL